VTIALTQAAMTLLFAILTIGAIAAHAGGL